MNINPLNLAYGKVHLPVQLPADVQATIIRKVPLPKLKDQRGAIREALDHPIGAKPLKLLARGRRSASILICDITRPVPNHLFLRPMIEDLIEAAILAENICVLVATGLHRPNEAIARSVERSGSREVAVIPEGPYVVPIFRA